GAAKAGVTVAPLNPNLSPEVMEQLIADLGAEWAIVDAEFAARVKPVLENAQVRALVTVAVGGPQPEESVSFREFISCTSAEEPETVIHGDDIWQIQF